MILSLSNLNVCQCGLDKICHLMREYSKKASQNDTSGCLATSTTSKPKSEHQTGENTEVQLQSEPSKHRLPSSLSVFQYGSAPEHVFYILIQLTHVLETAPLNQSFGSVCVTAPNHVTGVNDDY